MKQLVIALLVAVVSFTAQAQDKISFDGKKLYIGDYVFDRVRYEEEMGGGEYVCKTKSEAERKALHDFLTKHKKELEEKIDVIIMHIHLRPWSVLGNELLMYDRKTYENYQYMCKQKEIKEKQERAKRIKSLEGIFEENNKEE